MKVKEAKRLADEIEAEIENGQEPSSKTLAKLLGGLAVNLARIADAIERLDATMAHRPQNGG